jgi:hypothetical protein
MACRHGLYESLTNPSTNSPEGESRQNLKRTRAVGPAGAELMFRAGFARISGGPTSADFVLGKMYGLA